MHTPVETRYQDDMLNDDEYFGPPAPTIHKNHWHYANSVHIGLGVQALISDGINRAARHAAIGRITIKPKSC